MKKLVGMLAGVSLLAMGVGLARADTIDPLHGAICPTSSTCSDTETGGVVTVNQNSGTVQTFGFDVSPNGGTGTLNIIVLTPNNGTAGNGAVTDSVTGTGFTAATGFGTSLGVWNSGTLESFLGISAQPANPIGNYTGFDPGISGFNVYSINDTMSFTLPGPTADGTLPDEFNLTGALPLGSFIVGYFDEPNGTIATANSGALFVNTTAVASTPLPAALPMFLGGLGMLGLMAARRKRKSGTSVFAAA